MTGFEHISIIKKTLIAAGLLVIAGMFSACGPNENPLVVVPEPEFETIEIDANGMGMHYYSLKDKQVIAALPMNSWDLRICAQTDKYYFYVNTGKNMRIAKYDGKFSDAINVNTISQWQTDLVKNGKILTAMGAWGDFSFANPKSYGFTYVVDLGYLNMAGEFGYRKIEILGCSANTYTIKYGLLDDVNGDTIEIAKSATHNNVFFSFANGGNEVKIEPPASDWDLLFTQFGLATQVLKDSIAIDTTFSLTDMVFLNNTGRQLFCDTLKTFDNITFWDAENYSYSQNVDFIGNRWRYFDSGTNQFVLRKQKVFVLRDLQNHLYKFEFTKVDKSIPGKTRIEFKVKNM